MKKILIIFHTNHIWADNIKAMFNDIGYSTHFISLCSGDLFPDNIDDYSALVIMGGVMGVNDKNQLPWLKKEINSIQKALKSNIPTLGICLGGQILSHIYGGEVKKGEKGFSIGFEPVSVIKNDYIFGNELHNNHVCKWHNDCFTLPKTATLLATSEPYKNQAVKFADKVYGVQFHPEITLCRINKWYKEECHNYPKGVLSLEEFNKQGEEYISISENWLRLFFTRLLKN